MPVIFKDGHPDELCEDPVPDGEYWTLREFADRMDVPEATVRMWAHRHQIPCEHYYGRVYIPTDVRFRYKRPWMNRLRELQSLHKSVHKSAQI